MVINRCLICEKYSRNDRHDRRLRPQDSALFADDVVFWDFWSEHEQLAYLVCSRCHSETDAEMVEKKVFRILADRPYSELRLMLRAV